MSPKTVDVEKAQNDLKELLTLVSSGTEVVIVEGNVPIARLVPVNQRVAGLHSGAIWTSTDFDKPLPDDFWTGNE